MNSSALYNQTCTDIDTIYNQTRSNTDSVATIEPVDPIEFRQALTGIPTPLAFISATVNGKKQGILVGSLVGISLEPALLSISVQHTSSTWPYLRDAEQLGISLLNESQCQHLHILGGPSEKRFENNSWTEEGSAVLLSDASQKFVARVVEEYIAGDHVIAILAVDKVVSLGNHHKPVVYAFSEPHGISQLY